MVMMNHYPQLLRKYVADKAKAPSLIEIVLHMNLELYSLKRQEQVDDILCRFVFVIYRKGAKVLDSNFLHSSRVSKLLLTS